MVAKCVLKSRWAAPWFEGSANGGGSKPRCRQWASLCAEPLQALGGLLLKEMGNPIRLCVKEKMKICTSCASILHIMLVMLKLHLCKTLVLCQKEETPSVLELGASKDTEEKGEWKVRDGADLQSMGFRHKNCFLAVVFNIFWESPPNSCNLCISQRITSILGQ